MRTFDYTLIGEKLLTPKIVMMLSKIHEYKGTQSLYIETYPDVLSGLLEVAKIQSTDASNRIEGIYTSDTRLRAIVQEKVEPRNRNEREIAGYRDVLNTIHESYDSISIGSNYIKQLHRNLYGFTEFSFAGKFKNVDNFIEEIDNQGNATIRFKPMSAFETPEGIDRICKAFDEVLKKNEIDPLLLIPIFILDFLCIHPFNDGNGRMSRLLTLLMLYRSGYIVGKYVSVEKMIEKSKETYYDVLQESSQMWHEEQNNYLPFVEYTLGIILATYSEFISRVSYLSLTKVTKKERVRIVIKEHLGKISKRDIIEICPDISPTTIEAALAQLVKDGTITKTGNNKYSQYFYNRST